MKNLQKLILNEESSDEKEILWYNDDLKIKLGKSDLSFKKIKIKGRGYLETVKIEIEKNTYQLLSKIKFTPGYMTYITFELFYDKSDKSNFAKMIFNTIKLYEMLLKVKKLQQHKIIKFNSEGDDKLDNNLKSILEKAIEYKMSIEEIEEELDSI